MNSAAPPAGAQRRRDRGDLLVAVAAPGPLERCAYLRGGQAGRRAATRQLFRRHLNQMQAYLDVLLEELGGEVDSVVATLLYPRRPSERIAQELESLALGQGIMLVFYEDMDWKTPSE